MLQRSTALVGTMVLAACGATEPDVGPAASVALVGPPISAVVATDVEVTVRVTDARGKGVPDQLVDFVPSDGDGSFATAQVVTSASGEARNVWTLGTAARFQGFTARVIDRATGQAGLARFFGTHAQPGPVARLQLGFFRGHTVGTQGASIRLGTTVNVASLVGAAHDAYGNPIASPTLVVTGASPGWITDGGNVTSPSVEGEGSITFGGGTASATVRVFAVRDLRPVRLRATYACTHQASGVFEGGVRVDSTVAAMVVDSARADTDPGPARGQPLFGRPAADAYSYVLYASGPSTRYLTDGTTVTRREERDFIVNRQYPDSLFLRLVMKNGAWQGGTIPVTSVPSWIDWSYSTLRRETVSPLRFGRSGTGCIEPGQRPTRFVLEEY